MFGIGACGICQGQMSFKFSFDANCYRQKGVAMKRREDVGIITRSFVEIVLPARHDKDCAFELL